MCKKISENPLITYNDYSDALKSMIEPLKPYLGETSLRVGVTASHYDKICDGMEGFMRLTWGLSPLWNGGDDYMKEKYIKGFAMATDPESPYYFGEPVSYNQRIVEAAPYGVGLMLAPDVFWYSHPEEVRKNINRYLLKVNEVGIHNNNWLFFRVLVNAGLKKVGGEYSQKMIDETLDILEGFYLSNGWYSDGNTKQRDYYIAFAMHFYSLVYAANFEEEDPERCRRFKERACEFAKTFIYFFNEDGENIAFGRSLSYKFAVFSFFSALVYSNTEALPWGVIKGIIGRGMRKWFRRPIFDNAGVLTLGYGYPNISMCEDYNGQASQFWSFKSFLLLATDKNHPFWQAEELPLPKSDSIKPVPEALGIMYRTENDTMFLGSGQSGIPIYGTAEKYCKFAYSANHSFCVSKEYNEIKGTAIDNMLVFRHLGMSFIKRGCISHTIEGNVARMQWSPFDGITVETEIEPYENGYIRRHTINSEVECTAMDGGFSLPYVNNDYKTQKDDSSIVLTCDGNSSSMKLISGNAKPQCLEIFQNSNLSYPNVCIPYFEYEIKKGVTKIEIYTY